MLEKVHKHLNHYQTWHSFLHHPITRSFSICKYEQPLFGYLVVVPLFPYSRLWHWVVRDQPLHYLIQYFVLSSYLVHFVVRIVIYFDISPNNAIRFDCTVIDVLNRVLDYWKCLSATDSHKSSLFLLSLRKH